MEFTVPQFIEKESKIVGPFTFKQLIFVGTAGGICIFLYFSKIPRSVFFIATVILMGSAFALAFLRIEKITLPVFIKNLFLFSFSPKIFLWKKKNLPPKLITREKIEIKEEEKSPLKITEKSRLKDLLTRLETKQK